MYPRSRSRSAQPARVPIVAVSSSSPTRFSWRVRRSNVPRRGPLAFAEGGSSWYVFRMEPPSRKEGLFLRIIAAA
jgi:hypothetical protein